MNRQSAGKQLTFGSGFSGVGGFDRALEDAGMKCIWQAEIDKQCRSVLRRHWPDVTLLEDVKDATLAAGRIDLFCAGWPCQGNSVAGRRAGMADERSGLWGEVKRILAEFTPTWFLGENVPGILSVNEGRDWAAVLGDLAELGYGFAYRVLDSQWFGVPQRRRRVFLVGCLGDWRRAAEILFERDGLPWDSPPSRTAGEGVATCVRGGTDSGSNECGDKIAFCLNAKGGSGRIDGESETFIPTHTLRGEGFDASEDGTGRGTPIIPIDMRQASRGGTFTNNRPGGSSGGAPGVGIGDAGDPAFTVCDSHVPAVAFTELGEGHTSYQSTDVAAGFRGPAGGGSVKASLIAERCRTGVRRLTPLECERLQGWPDNWTRWDADGNELADSPRYRMCGNGVSMPPVLWIGRRIVGANQ